MNEEPELLCASYLNGKVSTAELIWVSFAQKRAGRRSAMPAVVRTDSTETLVMGDDVCTCNMGGGGAGFQCFESPDDAERHRSVD